VIGATTGQPRHAGASWRRLGDPDRLVVIGVLGLSALLLLVHLIGVANRPVESSDFFVFWSAAALLATGVGAESLYDGTSLAAFQAGFPWASSQHQPFPYPPSMALLLRPLAWLDYPSAKLVWLAGSFGLLAWALEVGRRPGRLIVLAAAPACLINLAFAQNGFLMTALIAGGLIRCRHQPVLAGILLGLATIKPQLGLAVPLLLIVQRRWLVIGVAAATGLALAGLSLALDGWPAWQAWLGQLAAFAARTIDNIDGLAPYLASLTAALIAAGMAPAFAQLAQAGAAALALLGLLVAAGRRDEVCAIAAALAAAFIVTPFAYVYDAVLLLPAVILLAERQLAAGAPPARPECRRLVLVFAWLAPFLSILLMPAGIPVIVLAAAAVMLLALAPSSPGRQPP